MEIDECMLYRYLKEKESKFISQIDDLFKFVNPIYVAIQNVYSNYTQHGIEHVCNVMNYMADLVNELEQLSDLEITCMIYSAMLHDIGMAVDEEDIENAKSGKKNQKGYYYKAVLRKCGNNEKAALQEYFRPVHGIRSAEMIKNGKVGEAKFPEKVFQIPKGKMSSIFSFAEIIAAICQAHTEEFCWLENEGALSDKILDEYRINGRYIALLLRIADSIDIDENRAPYSFYKFINPMEFSRLEWKQHFVITNREKFFTNESTGKKFIYLSGSCDEVKVYEKIMSYIRMLERELKRCIRLTQRFQVKRECYTLNLDNEIQNDIETKGFTFAGIPIVLEYLHIKELLMGANIYGSSQYGLRELLQNSIDACKLLSENSDKELYYDMEEYKPCVNIILEKEKGQVRIVDNGQGMNEDIIWNYFLQVGKSYYTSKEFEYSNTEYKPISHYGIGFLSCFMLSDKVIVKTSFIGETDCYEIHLEKDSEYVSILREKRNRRPGTEVILDYESFMKEFAYSEENIEKFIQENFLDDGIDIVIKGEIKKQIKMRKFEELSCSTWSKYSHEIRENIIKLDEYLKDLQVSIKIRKEKTGRNPFYGGVIEDFFDDKVYMFEEDEAYTGKFLKELGGEEFLKDWVLNKELYWQEVIVFDDSYDLVEKLSYNMDLYSNNFVSFYDNLEHEKKIILGMDFVIDEEKCVHEEMDIIAHEYDCSELLENLDCISDIPCIIQTIRKKVITGTGKEILLYNINHNVIFDKNRQKNRAYINNIYVANVNIIIPALLDGIVIESICFNSNNKALYPDVSRNNISLEESKQLSYAIGKALHLYILEHSEFTSEQRKLFETFLNNCYKENNCFLKE